MANLSDISVIKDVLSRHGFTFSKALGQNFLVNPTVCPRMAEICGADENTGVIEVGAGIGVLTKELAMRAKKVVSIELDTRLLPVLDETLAEFDNVEVINADILKIDLHKLIEEKFQGMRVVVCANLPYYITSPVIMMLLESKLPIDAVTVMIQKEVADRLCADAGTRNAGAITVSVNYFADAAKMFDVSRGSFIPMPNVDSAVIKLDIKKEPDIHVSDEKKFFHMVKAAFSMRRKTALNSISSGMGLSKTMVADAIEKSGLSPNVRAEQMTMEQLAVLCEHL
ncbi:MAG: 16S rRNA (adenine(1518)-N(6)/adenine(1519)-N(6))-dimethyltransferase RsmA [Faecalibacterium sp.]|nr:16S rRNA (adenine(1518)-N(6)/adenine(1519)-N(6))-dimethyltransferase RsmA [Ruminococcus sp.]MCM1392543.1 16S rRNA (adenine(1518)-N(6)/adenine(1519)-N(6))-dimethyltransferase RsmA [Ruminococcus sp.]MCM1486255.1 16S rRNA (adenine(1518)-N(6)/adenine(1519)-N(6))-dimethyltransferase RsmA [Faecalibacterium sp.]